MIVRERRRLVLEQQRRLAIVRLDPRIVDIQRVAADEDAVARQRFTQRVEIQEGRDSVPTLSWLIAGAPMAICPLTRSTFDPGMRSSETRLG